jgi:hypothetical protein
MGINMKFKYDCLNNHLSRLEGEYAYQIPEQQAFVDSCVERKFILDTSRPNH